MFRRECKRLFNILSSQFQVRWRMLVLVFFAALWPGGRPHPNKDG